jgi:hypothetical protein
MKNARAASLEGEPAGNREWTQIVFCGAGVTRKQAAV